MMADHWDPTYAEAMNISPGRIAEGTGDLAGLEAEGIDGGGGVLGFTLQNEVDDVGGEGLQFV